MACIIPSFLLAVHQWGDLWRALFLALYLQASVGRSVACVIPSFLLAVHQWGDLWGVLLPAFYLQYISGEICGVYYS